MGLSPIYEWRTGFPWSAVNEFQDFVGERNKAGRLPTVSTLDFTLARPWRFRKYHFTAGLKVYNVFDAGNERDVQNNITSPDYGKFYNPIQRSIGFVFWHHSAVTLGRSWAVSDAATPPPTLQGRTTLSRGTRRRSSLSTSSGSRLARRRRFFALSRRKPGVRCA